MPTGKPQDRNTIFQAQPAPTLCCMCGIAVNAKAWPQHPYTVCMPCLTRANSMLSPSAQMRCCDYTGHGPLAPPLLCPPALNPTLNSSTRPVVVPTNPQPLNFHPAHFPLAPAPCPDCQPLTLHPVHQTTAPGHAPVALQLMRGQRRSTAPARASCRHWLHSTKCLPALPSSGTPARSHTRHTSRATWPAEPRAAPGTVADVRAAGGELAPSVAAAAAAAGVQAWLRAASCLPPECLVGDRPLSLLLEVGRAAGAGAGLPVWPAAVTGPPPSLSLPLLLSLASLLLLLLSLLLLLLLL